MSGGTSCWSCTYQQTGGTTLLGFCRWFVVHLNQGAKEIPAHVVDKGCDHHERKKLSPRVPHFHTCRNCPERHRYECLNTACSWNVLLDCNAVSARDVNETRRPSQ